LDEGLLGGGGETELGLAGIVVIEDEEVVGGEGLGGDVLGGFGDPDFEFAGVFESGSEVWGDATPVVARDVLAGEDEGLDFLGLGGGLGLEDEGAEEE